MLPRFNDVTLGILFIVIDAAAYILGFYLTANKTADPRVQYLHVVFVVYGYFQSLVGFFVGLAIARITQTDIHAAVKEDVEEEMLLSQA
jgi:hypothetical protein